MLGAALEANQELARLAGELGEENARLREENAEQAAELERLRADLAVLQRMVFGRSSERARRGLLAVRMTPPVTGRGPGPPARAEARPGGAGGAAGLLASAAG